MTEERMFAMAINSLSASSYGLSGMVSGMNTQEMVEKMLSGTKSKITAQQQKKAQLEYKQDLYRGLATQLRALKDSYFSFQSGSATNLYSNSFFNNMTATTSSKYFTATATTSSSTGTSRIDYIKQMATAAKLQGTKKASGRLKGEVRTATGGAGSLADYVKTFKDNNVGNLKFTVDGADGAVEVELTKDDLMRLVGKTNSQAAQELNTLFQEKAQAQGRTVADVVVNSSNSKMTFSSQNGGAISISGNDKGLSLVGLTGTTVSSNGKLDTSMNVNKLLPSINVSVDGGTAKTVYFNPDKYLSGDNYADAIQQSLQDALDTAFGHVIEVGADKYDVTASDGSIVHLSEFTFDIAGNDPSRRFNITGGEDALNILGIKTGASNKITESYYLDEINFADKLQGNVFKFTINDVDFNITGNTTLNSLMTQINSSDANVKLTYNKDTDKFALESKTEGEGARIAVSQEQGNLLTALLGSDVVKGNTEVKGKELTSGTRVDATYGDFAFKDNTYTSGTVAFNVVLGDGTQRSYNLRIPAPDKNETGSEYYQNKDEMVRAINKALEENVNQVLKDSETGLDPDLRLYIDNSGQVSFLAEKGVKIETSTGGSGSFLTALGFTNRQTNAANRDTTLQDMKIDPAKVMIDDGTGAAAVSGLNASSTMGDLEAALQDAIRAKGGVYTNASVTFDASEGAFHISGVTGDGALKITAESTADSTGATTPVDLFLNGGQTSFTAQAHGAIDEGQDAILSYNGTEVRRSSNTFTMDGVSYTLTGVFDGRTKDANGNYQLADGSASVRSDGIMVDKNDGHILNATLNTIFSNLENGTGGVTAAVHGAQLDDQGRLVDSYGQYISLQGDQVDSSHAVQVIDGGGYLLIDAAGNALADPSQVVTASPDAKYIYDEVAGDTTITRNTDQIYEGIMKFVEDYNNIMKSIHTLLTEKAEYKNYLPLTDEQKSAMSDREIELWEEKAKTGLLRSDSYLNDIWDSLRATLYKKPSNSSIAIYDLGITTQFDTEYGGQLVVDQAKLKSMLQSNAEDVANLFAGSNVDSLGKLMSDALDRAASSSIASPGILTQVAGASSRTDTSSNLYKQMKSIDDNLETLFDRYDSEYSRYWQQFNAMEQMIQQMNQQSSWLSQQFSS